MSYERPEDKWKREKQYQPPAPGQGGLLSNTPDDEAFWMQEKQGRPGANPNQPQNPQEAQWMREKQGQFNPPPQANGQEQWMAEKRGQQGQPGQGQPPRPNGQDAQWMQEKRGGAPTPPQEQQWMAEKQGGAPIPTPEQQWMREKQGQPAGQPGQYQQPGQNPQPGQNQWMREKQGLPPMATQPGPQPTNRTPGQDELAWHQEKNFKAPGTNRKLYLILGGIGALVLIAIIVVLILLLAPKPSPTPAATATASVTTAAATTAATTTSAVTTAPVTTAPATTGAATTAPATTGAAGDSARLLSLAQDAANNSRWQDVVNSLELLSPSDPNFSKAKPLLVKAYFQLGEQAEADKSNSQESANLALTNFRKANALDPSFDGLAKELQRADTFATGLLQYQSEQFSQAVDTIKPLYDDGQLQTEGNHYRNSADILYNSYLKLGDKVFDPNKADALTQARNFYSLALAVDVPNKDDANGKLQQVTGALKLLGATPKK